jgi:hypothetical protein
MGWAMVGKNVAVSVQSGSTGTYGQYAIVDAMTAMTLPNVRNYAKLGSHTGPRIDEFREPNDCLGHA